MAQVSINLEPQKVFNRSNLRNLIRLILVVLAIVALGSFSWLNILNLKSNYTQGTDLYSTEEYHIVFLANNLFYFCQLGDFSAEYLQCNNPYYLVRRKETNAQGLSEEKVFVSKPGDEEIYQPSGPIFVLKDNIVYIAKVGSESEVLKYILGQTT